jgi:hypothetical protein
MFAGDSGDSGSGVKKRKPVGGQPKSLCVRAIEPSPNPGDQTGDHQDPDEQTEKDVKISQVFGVILRQPEDDRDTEHAQRHEQPKGK